MQSQHCCTHSAGPSAAARLRPSQLWSHAELRNLELNHADDVGLFTVLRSAMHARCRPTIRNISLICGVSQGIPAWDVARACLNHAITFLPLFTGLEQVTLPASAGDGPLPTGRLSSVLRRMPNCAAVTIAQPPRMRDVKGLLPEKASGGDALYLLSEQVLTEDGRLAPLPHIKLLELLDFRLIDTPLNRRSLHKCLAPFVGVTTLRFRYSNPDIPPPPKVMCTWFVVAAAHWMPNLEAVVVVRAVPNRCVQRIVLFPLPQPARSAQVAPMAEEPCQPDLAGTKHGRCCDCCGLEMQWEFW